MAKKKFRVLAGTHREGSQTYTAGQVVESELDLETVFGANKFMAENKFAGGGESRGENVTEEFPYAEEAGLLVFKKKQKWFLYDSEGDAVAGRLAKKDVEDAVGIYLDEIEDEDADSGDEA